MIEIITTGGTIDKVYFDKKSDYQVGDPFIGNLLTKMNVNVDYQISPLMRIDSLEMDDDDRRKLGGCCFCVAFITAIVLVAVSFKTIDVNYC